MAGFQRAEPRLDGVAMPRHARPRLEVRPSPARARRRSVGPSPGNYATPPPNPLPERDHRRGTPRRAGRGRPGAVGKATTRRRPHVARCLWPGAGPAGGWGGEHRGVGAGSRGCAASLLAHLISGPIATALTGAGVGQETRRHAGLQMRFTCTHAYYRAHMPARRVALYNWKGSTGKTTLATATAAAIARAGVKVVLLDADKYGDSIRLASGWEGVTVAPWERGYAANGAHLVLIDCPPDRREAAGALADADLIVVPVVPEPLQVRRLADLLADLPAQSVVVVNGYYRSPAADELVEDLDEMLGERLWRPWIPRRTAFPRSQRRAIPPQDFKGRPADVVDATSALAVKMLAWAAAN